MIELTPQQWPELATPEPTIIDPRTREAYVLIKKDVFERLKGLLYDDGNWTPEEQLQVVAESGKRAGWDEPEMDVYDNYDENHKKLCQ